MQNFDMNKWFRAMIVSVVFFVMCYFLALLVWIGVSKLMSQEFRSVAVEISRLLGGARTLILIYIVPFICVLLFATVSNMNLLQIDQKQSARARKFLVVQAAQFCACFVFHVLAFRFEAVNLF